MASTRETQTVSKARTDEKTVGRAVELRKQGLGLPAIAKKLTEEGHKSAHGKALRPQTIRQWLLRELKVDRLTEKKDEPAARSR